MTPRELAAFNAGVRHAADLALTVALAIEIRDDADHLRQRSAVAALQALAEELKLSVKVPPSTDDASMQECRDVAKHEHLQSGIR